MSSKTQETQQHDAELVHYYRLHDGLSEAIESGRLTEGVLPDDYKWLCHMLETVPQKRI